MDKTARKDRKARGLIVNISLRQATKHHRTRLNTIGPAKDIISGQAREPQRTRNDRHELQPCQHWSREKLAFNTPNSARSLRLLV